MRKKRGVALLLLAAVCACACGCEMIPQQESAYEVELTVGGCVEEGALRAIIDAFEAENKGVTVSCRPGTGEGLLALLESGENIDILLVGAEEAGELGSSGLLGSALGSLWGEGYLDDLEQYESIQRLIAQSGCVSGVWEAGRIGGTLVGLPAGTVSGWTVDAVRLKQSGLGLPVYGWSWDDVLDSLEHGRPWLYVVSFDGDGLAPPFLTDYIANFLDVETGKINFNEPVFRRLMRKWKAAYEAGLVTVDNPNAVFRQNAFSTQAGAHADGYVPSPVFSEKRTKAAFTSGGLLTVNAQSELKALAAEFLAFAYGRQQNLSPTTMDGFGTVLYREEASRYEDGTGVTPAIARYGLMREDGMAFYRSQARRASPALLATSASRRLLDLCYAYVRGEASLDTTAQEMSKAFVGLTAAEK